jgi:hypothetical protein
MIDRVEGFEAVNSLVPAEKFAIELLLLLQMSPIK